MAKQKEAEKPAKQKEAEIEIKSLDEKSEFEITLFASSGFVKKDTIKKVSGNVANALIKKGFAELKTK